MDPLAELIGASPAIVALRDQIRRILLRQSELRRLPPVLILGETGTGKGLLAQALHRAGPREAGPLVDVNCAAIPENLLEAEMFGFERGAFTDARQAKAGLFQAAHGGTIFLDEVGLLPETLQGKLLKVIEDRTVRRLGSTRSEPVDAWIVTATSVDLVAAVRERRFREDLYHRLNVLSLAMPPLRERNGDVLLLAEHFLARACNDYGLAARHLDAGARAALVAHPWPGNVRELGNLMERVALLSEDARITAEDLALGGSASAAAPAGRTSAGEEKAPTAGPLRDEMDRREREHLLGALQRSGWNITRTAGQLGISRDTLRYRIDKHGLAQEDPRAPRARARPAAAMPAEAAAPAETRSGEPSPRGVRWEPRRVTLLGAALPRTGEPGAGPGAGRAIDGLVEKAQGFGGQIVGLGPTSVVVAFGLEPVEDGPRRAAHTALAMQKNAERGRWSAQGPGPLRLAVHAEEVLVGHVAGALQMDADGARQARETLDALLAEAVGITVSAAVRPFIERRFLLAPPERPEAGGSSPPPAWRLLAYEPTEGRLTRLAGRRQELDLLESRLELAQAGQGQVIGIVGEPGIGKSRLLLEFRQRLGDRAVTWLQGHCVSFGVATPYLPVVDVVRQLLGGEEGDEGGRAAARASAEAIGCDVEALPFLVSLLGPDLAPEHGELSAEAIRARTYGALSQLVARASRRQPLVLVIEDLHWIDRTSEAWLVSLVEGIPGLPVLFVATWRAGYRPPWAERSFATQLALQPLAQAHSRDLVQTLLGAPAVPESVMQSILERAEGNPFFIEELCHVVTQPGGSAGSEAVPGTVEEVLRTRVDRLDEAPRRLLQAAAVLGRAAPLDLLRAVSESAPAIDAHLAELRRLEFLHERESAEGPTLTFKHTLTQEVVYASLPSGRRAELHAAAARALETMYAGRTDEVLDRLAHHYSRARDPERALDYLTRFAERAARAYAHTEAAAALEEAARQTAAGPTEGRERRLLDVVLRRAASLNFLGRFEELRSALLLEHREGVERLGDPRVSAPYYFWLAHVHGLLGEPEPMLEHGRRSLEEATRAQDPMMLGCAHGVLAYECFWSGRAPQGTEHGRQAVAYLERTTEQWWLGYQLWVLSINYAQVGDFAGAFAAVARVAAVGQALDDSRLIAQGASSRGAYLALVGEWDEAIAACQWGIAQARDPVTRAISMGFLGGAYLEKGDVDQALPAIERAVEQYALHRMHQTHGWFTALLAEAHLGRGDLARARALGAEALRLTEATKYRYAAGWARRTLGRIALGAGDLDDAGRRLTEALEAFVAMGARHEAGRTHLDLARLAQRRHDREACTRHLDAASATFAALDIPRYVERTRRLAEELGGERA